MKRTALLAVALLLFVQQAVASPWLKDIASAQKKAKEKNQLIFVDLFADWCGWCHRFEQEVIPSQAFQSSTDNMILLRLNTEDGKDGSRFAHDFGINSVPRPASQQSVVWISLLKLRRHCARLAIRCRIRD